MKTNRWMTGVFVSGVWILLHIIPVSRETSSISAYRSAEQAFAQETPAEKTYADNAGPAFLETIRCGRHKEFSSIVFQFSKRIVFTEPRREDDHLHIVLREVSTSLPPFRQYKTIDSWVRLEAAGSDTAVRIGIPSGHKKTRVFQMENPPRLVVNLYDGDPRASQDVPVAPPVLRASIPSQGGISRDDSTSSLIVINPPKTVADHNPVGEPATPTQGTPDTEAPPPDRSDGREKMEPKEASAGIKGGGGIGSGGGGGGTPRKRYRVKITPKISVRGEYDDNIFLSKTGKKGDVITTISPGLLFYLDSAKNGLQLEYNLGWVRYHDMSENDFVRHNGRLKFWQRLTRHLTFNVSDAYIKTNDLFDQNLPPELRSQRIRHTATPYQRNDLDTSLDYQIGPQSRVSTGYRHGYLDNQDPDVEDVVEHSPYAKVLYWLDNKDGFELGYEYRRFDYTPGERYGGGNVDLDAHDVDLGYMHRLGRQSLLHVNYGFANRNFKGIPVSYHVHDGSVKLDHRVSRFTTVVLDIGYFHPTGIPINPGLEYTLSLEHRLRRGRAFLSAQRGWDEGFMDVEPRAFTRYWGAGAGFEYEPVRDLEAYIGIDYRKNDYYLEEQQDDDTVGGRCGVKYRFLRWFTADLEYAHRRRISKDPNNEYSDNRVTFTITASKPQPYHLEF